MNKRTLYWIVGLGILLYSFVHPIPRAIWIFLWPIDPGHGDTVVLVGVTLVLTGWVNIPSFLSRRKK
jgi:hypothetical protein